MTDPIEQSQPSAPPQQPTAAPVLAVNDPRRKSPFLACVLSVMPGLGQVYTGYYQRGFAHAIIVAVIIAFLAGGVGPLTPLAGIFLAFFWLYNVVDAGRRAALFNEVLAGRTGVELPQDIQMPGMGGSVAGGITIALVGFIMLLNTRFDVSMDWIEEWWPMALIVFGAYLVYKAREEKAAAAKASASSWDADGDE